MDKFHHSTGVLVVSCALLAMGALQPARASCGATFCSVNTQWETQGVWTEPGLRFTLRYEYTDQNQLRSGADEVEPGGVLGTHDEIAPSTAICRSAWITRSIPPGRFRCRCRS